MRSDCVTSRYRNKTDLSCIKVCWRLTSSARFFPSLAPLGLKMANQSAPSFLRSAGTAPGSKLKSMDMDALSTGPLFGGAVDAGIVGVCGGNEGLPVEVRSALVFYLFINLRGRQMQTPVRSRPQRSLTQRRQKGRSSALIAVHITITYQGYARRCATS